MQPAPGARSRRGGAGGHLGVALPHAAATTMRAANSRSGPGSWCCRAASAQPLDVGRNRLDFIERGGGDAHHLRFAIGCACRGRPPAVPPSTLHVARQWRASLRDCLAGRARRTAERRLLVARHGRARQQQRLPGRQRWLRASPEVSGEVRHVFIEESGHLVRTFCRSPLLKDLSA